MKNNIYLGIGKMMIPIPSSIWKGMISRNAMGAEKSLDFMTEKHHKIRDFVVRELLIEKTPLTSEFIAQRLDLSIEEVNEILDDLEKRLTFLYRNQQGEVTWAYPVTVSETPHQIIFNNEEQLQAA